MPEPSSLTDAYSERIVLSALFEHGAEIFYDIDMAIATSDFAFPENALIYSAFRQLITVKNIKRPDIVSIIAEIGNLDKSALSKYNLVDYLEAISQDKVLRDNVVNFTTVIMRLSVARGLCGRLEAAKASIQNLKGQETVREIIALAEKPIFDFTLDLMSEQEKDIEDVGEGLEDYLKFLQTEKPEILGIPTGFPLFDEAIGGGMRAPGVHLIGARTKVGKTFFAVNAAYNVTGYKIPVLYLDTEMTKQSIIARLAARISGLMYGDIEKGLLENKDIAKIAGTMGTGLFYYKNISGKHHSEWLSIMRKWIMKVVGFDENGQTKPCLIILDYIKTMDLRHTGQFQEYQYLGQVITDLHVLCVQYNIPILSLAQLNRDGIDQEDAGVISGSDRLLFLCSSFSILKKKSDEEIAADGPEAGDRKLVPILSRFGPGLDRGEYINIHSDLGRSLLEEGELNTAARRNKSRGKMVLNAEPTETIPI